METELFPRFDKKSGNHIFTCTTKGCNNKVKDNGTLCQVCSDNFLLKEKLDNIKFLKETITEKLKLIENFGEKIEKTKEEIHDLERELDIEKLSITYGVDVVSDNFKLYRGSSSEGSAELETHCTIVRVKNSPGDVYFGHVTLLISYLGKETYRWHYGAKVNSEYIPNDLQHKFWSTKNQKDINLPVSDFGNFSNITATTTLAEIMIHHLDKCAEFFRKLKQWPNQVWFGDDVIDGTNANDLIKQFTEKNHDREMTDFSEVVSKKLKRIQERQIQLELAKQKRKAQKQKKVYLTTEEGKQSVLTKPDSLKGKDREEEEQGSLMGKDREEQEEEPGILMREYRKNIQTKQEEKDREARAEQLAIEARAEQLAIEANKDREARAKQLAIEARAKQLAIEANKDRKRKEKQKRNEDNALATAARKAAADLKEKENQEELRKAEDDALAHNMKEENIAIEYFTKIQEYCETEIKKYLDMQNDLDKLEKIDPMSDNVIELRHALISRYLDYLDLINSYIKELDLKKYKFSKRVNVKINKTEEKISNIKTKIEKIIDTLTKKHDEMQVLRQLNYVQEVNEDITLEQEKLSNIDLDTAEGKGEASQSRMYLIDKYQNCLAMHRDIISYIQESHLLKERKQFFNDILDTLVNIKQTEDKIHTLLELEKKYLLDFYTHYDQNEDDHIICENILIFKPDYTYEKALQFVEKIKNLKEKLNITSTFSTKNILIALKLI